MEPRLKRSATIEAGNQVIRKAVMSWRRTTVSPCGMVERLATSREQAPTQWWLVVACPHVPS